MLYTIPSITTEEVLSLFEYKSFSRVGSNAYAKEQAAYMYFRTVMDEIERKSYWPLKENY